MRSAESKVFRDGQEGPKKEGGHRNVVRSDTRESGSVSCQGVLDRRPAENMSRLCRWQLVSSRRKMRCLQGLPKKRSGAGQVSTGGFEGTEGKEYSTRILGSGDEVMRGWLENESLMTILNDSTNFK